MALVRFFAFRDDAVVDGAIVDGKAAESIPAGRRANAPGGLKMIATLEQSQNAGIANSNPIVASLEGVNKNYGSVRALRGVDFRVRAGEVVALLGPNGAGKTTAVKLLLGLLPAQFGKSACFRRRPDES